jgi:hypothetical protein
MKCIGAQEEEEEEQALHGKSVKFLAKLSCICDLALLLRAQ